MMGSGGRGVSICFATFGTLLPSGSGLSARSHGLVIAEIDERRGDPAYADAVYRELWEQRPDGCRVRHFEIDRGGLMLLAMNWPGGLSVDARVAVIEAFNALRRRFLAESGPAALHGLLAPLNATVAADQGAL